MECPRLYEIATSYPRILVTGPFRSGTTIAAKMIQEIRGDSCTLYEDIQLGRDYKLAASKFNATLTAHGTSVVIQSPPLFPFIREFTDVLVVYTHRKLAEIMASEKRVKRYHTTGTHMNELRDQFLNGFEWDYWRHRHIAELMDWLWYTRAKWLVPEYLRADLYYPKDLMPHPLWIDPEFRTKFAVKQTEIAHVGG